MSDLSPQPEPHSEPGETHPGGVDAIDEVTTDAAIPDLDPDSNPAVDDALSDEITQPDEPEQSDEEVEPEHEAPA